MLTITQTAAEALDSIAEAAPVAEGAGVRITEDTGAEGATAYRLTIAERPDPQDHVLERDGADLFLGPQAAQSLDDKVLDARVEGDQVGFVIGQQ